MPNDLAFFAIHADDVERARVFYQNVFGWHFEPWGPPDFYLIRTGDPDQPGVRGGLQARQVPLQGTGMRGFECTIGVADVDEAARRIEDHGGRIKLERTTIPSVGHMILFLDTERNEVGAMEYDENAR